MVNILLNNFNNLFNLNKKYLTINNYLFNLPDEINKVMENPNLRELKPAEKIGKIGVNRIRLIEFGFEQMAKS